MCCCQADLPGIGTVNAVGYSRARSRVSYYVLCRRKMSHGGEQRRVAKVLHFLLVSAPGLPDLRLAVCDIFKEQPSLAGGSVLVAKADAFDKRSTALALDKLDAVLVSAEPRPPRPADARKAHFYNNTLGKLYFARHGNVSRLG